MAPEFGTGSPQQPNPGPGQEENKDQESIKKKLFRKAMKGKWPEVAQIYEAYRWVQEEKITWYGDTALHVAVSSGDGANVTRLMEKLHEDDVCKVLKMTNDKEDTPLHLAAALGMVKVCLDMAQPCPKLVVEARNVQGETPLFVAVRHGHRDAFFALQSVITKEDQQGMAHCRRTDGDTILHAAIFTEHFDLALEIIYRYPKLVNFINARGESALHILASKPSVFKSGTRFNLLDNIIYHCVFVDLIKIKNPNYEKIAQSQQLDGQELRANHQACYDFFSLLKDIFKAAAPSIFRKDTKKKNSTPDEENQGHRKRNSQSNTGQGRQIEEISGTQEGQSTQQNSMEQNNLLQHQPKFPENYKVCFHFFKIAMKVLLIIIGVGLWRVEEIQLKKRNNRYAYQIMKEVVIRCAESGWEFGKDGKKPPADDSLKKEFPDPPDISVDGSKQPTEDKTNTPADGSNQPTEDKTNTPVDGSKPSTKDKPVAVPPKEDGTKQSNEDTKDKPVAATPILVAAKMGVTEMVKLILKHIPVAVLEVDQDEKNIILLAVEHRQPRVYDFMLKRAVMKNAVFGRADKKGNSALHLAATFGENRPWVLPGAALQMQWEIKWYKYVLNSMGREFFAHYNYQGETARDVFTRTHKDLVTRGGDWLTHTSESCSVVAALIATVAFTSATTVPGGLKQDTGLPIFEGRLAFKIFAISALVALCFSVTSLVMFLSILTSRYEEWDFEIGLPVKLMVGLTTLFVSIGANLISFCAGHFFVMENQLKTAAYPIYAIVCLPVTFFAVSQFPLYVDLIKASIATVPERTRKHRSF